MHASYQIIIQLLSLAYTTQACISSLKTYANASKHMNMHISNATNQSLWACSPYLCASLVRKTLTLLYSSMLLPLYACPSSTSPHDAFSYLCSNFFPFVINFHKRCASFDTKDCIGVDGWHLNLAFFMDTTKYVGMTPLVALEIPHVGSLTLIPIGGAPPLCHSMGHPLDNLELL